MQVFSDDSPHLDRFGLLLSVTLASVLVLSLVDLREPVGELGEELGMAVVTGSVGATLLLALRAAGVARRWRLAAELFVAGAVVISLVLLALDIFVDRDLTAHGATGPSPLWAVMSVVAPLAVVARLMRHRETTRETLLGGVCGFLLISLSFYFVFLSVETLQQSHFFGQPEPTTSFMYFSLVTITTLGYGDIAADTELGQLLSGVEAVTGQVYLVTFIAFFVGLYASSRTRPSDSSGNPDRPSE